MPTQSILDAFCTYLQVIKLIHIKLCEIIGIFIKNYKPNYPGSNKNLISCFKMQNRTIVNKIAGGKKNDLAFTYLKRSDLMSGFQSQNPNWKLSNIDLFEL